MAERTTRSPKKAQNENDSWDATVKEEVGAHFANADLLSAYFLSALEEFVKQHDHSYKKAFIDLDYHDGLMLVHARKMARLKAVYSPTVRYLAQLVTGTTPTDTPSEQSVRETFAILNTAPLVADDYIGSEINDEIREQSLRKAALAHSGGNQKLAEAYCQLTPQQPFFKRFRLSAAIQR